MLLCVRVSDALFFVCRKDDVMVIVTHVRPEEAPLLCRRSFDDH